MKEKLLMVKLGSEPRVSHDASSMVMGGLRAIRQFGRAVA